MGDKLLVRAYNVGCGDCIYVRIPNDARRVSHPDRLRQERRHRAARTGDRSTCARTCSLAVRRRPRNAST